MNKMHLQMTVTANNKNKKHNDVSNKLPNCPHANLTKMMTYVLTQIIPIIQTIKSVVLITMQPTNLHLVRLINSVQKQPIVL